MCADGAYVGESRGVAAKGGVWGEHEWPARVVGLAYGPPSPIWFSIG